MARRLPPKRNASRRLPRKRAFFYDDHGLFDDEEVQVQSVACGERIAAALGRNRAVLLYNHGLLTVGASPPKQSLGSYCSSGSPRRT